MDRLKNLFWSTLAAFTLGAATINAQDTNFHARVENTSGQGHAGKNDNISSVWNNSQSFDERNFTPTDLQMILYQYSRPPGNKIIDKDDGF